MKYLMKNPNRINLNNRKMKSQHAALVNSIVLIIIGFWGYAANNFATHTAIIPLGSGILFMILSLLLKTENKNILLLIISLTLLLILAFSMPFLRNAKQADLWGMFRIGIEMLVSAMALIVYLRNFVQLNKNKTLNA